jgi:secernin
MGGDTVVALGRATVDGYTLLGHNSDRPVGESQRLCQTPGRSHSAGEMVPAQCIQLPQARQTYAVLGHQPAGLWGYTHGVNEHGVAVGHTAWRSKLQGPRPGLIGTDLVRLTLERVRTAQQAVDLVTELVAHHGQGNFPDGPTAVEGDAALLVADAREAFALECAGSSWVMQEVQQVRAATNVGIVRQDWNRIAPGLASRAIERGWWPGDGSKLDFAGAVSAEPLGEASALRRWGRATLLLEQQSGHIDVAFLRRLLSDHYEGMQSEVDPLQPAVGPTPLCRHAHAAGGLATAASLVVRLGAEPGEVCVAWCAFGPPCAGVYFPLFLEGELPAAFTGAASEGLGRRVERLHAHLRQSPKRWEQARASFGLLQARIDQEAEEFVEEATALKRRGASAELQRQAGLFMQHHLERFEEVLDGFWETVDRPALRVR